MEDVKLCPLQKELGVKAVKLALIIVQKLNIVILAGRLLS